MINKQNVKFIRKLTFLFFCLFIAGIGMVFAQSSVTGKVIAAEDGEPIIGATVMVKGTTVGTITGSNGEFTISVPSASRTLVVSFIGMKSVEVQAKANLVVALENEASELEEILVVGYGTAKKSSFTGSAAVVKGEQLVKMETSNVTKSLEGAIAGVQISSSTGQPGSSASIRIRGLGSISASQTPLIIVDGVPYEGSLNSISPQDIETLNVLKDAAANSMYGARGSNGVILITTKQAQKGVTKVNLDTRFGVNSRGVSAYDVVTSTADYYELTWEARRNGLAPSMGYLNASLDASNNLIGTHLGYNIYQGVADAALIDPLTGKINSAASAKKWNDSWLNDPFSNGIRQEYNMNISGGSDNTSAYFSIGYIDDEGYVTGSNFSRFSSRVKVDQKINNNIKAGLNIAYAKTNSNTPIDTDGGTNYSNVFFFSQNIAPIYPIYKYDLATGAQIYDVDGNRALDFGSNNISNGTSSLNTRAYAANINPLFKLQNDATEIGFDNFSSRGYVELKILEGLKFTANIGYDVFASFYTDYVNPVIGDGKDYGGIGYKESMRYSALNANQLIDYEISLGSHNIKALIGHETKADDVWYLYGSKMRFYDPYNPEFSNAGSSSALTSYTSQYKLEGYLSRLVYDYNDKYYFSASYRRDASSRFHPDVRWGNFWSVGGAWRAKEESFLIDVDAVSNLRLKASYGTQGNDAISRQNLYEDQYTLVSDGVNASPSLTFRGNPELTWEKSNNFNAGFELGLFHRVNLNADFFIKETKDMLYQKPLPPSGGTPSWIWDNQIDMKNTGVEVELLVDIIKQNQLKWDVTLNLTTYKNELTRLPADKTDPAGYVAEVVYWRKLGGSLYDWYRPQYAGVDPTTGLSMWYKGEGDDKTTTTNYSEAKYYETGKSAIPDLYGGLSTNLTAYGFDFGIQTAFQLGGWVYDGAYATLMGGGSTAGQNWHKDIYKRWTPTNSESDVPRLSSTDQNVNEASDRFLTSASYFSLKNVTLGYTVPKKVLNTYKIQSVRVFVSADNIALISARKGLDPRQTFTGTTYSGTYSALRTTSIGLNVSF